MSTNVSTSPPPHAGIQRFPISNGSTPSSSSSENLRRVDASGFTTARQIRPTARWSAWLTYRRSSSHRRLGSGATSTSGRNLRTSRVMARRRSRVTSTIPSSTPRNTHSSTPRTSHAARCSIWRISASSSRRAPGSFEPADPSVTHTYATWAPSRVQAATVPALPNSASSGWAKTTSARSKFMEARLAEPARTAHRPARESPLRPIPGRKQNGMGRERRFRLARRFALSTLVAFIAIGASLSVVVSRQLRGRQEDAARFHAQFVADSVLPDHFQASDLQAPFSVTSPRYHELLSVVRTRILRRPVVRIKIWRTDGTVLFSDEPRLVGRRFSVDEDLKEAFAGETIAGVS